MNPSDIDGLPVHPCVGSGFCCKKARCVLGALKHGPGDNCPSLVWKDGRHWCGEVLNTEGAEQQKVVAHLYIGEGCCSPLNSDRLIILRGQKP